MQAISRNEENGYATTTYTNGSLVKIATSKLEIDVSKKNQEQLSDEELFRLETTTSLEYLTCMVELNTGI